MTAFEPLEDWEWTPAPDELAADHIGLHLDEDVPCPKCGHRLDKAGPVWVCDQCGAVMQVPEVVQNPHDLSDET